MSDTPKDETIRSLDNHMPAPPPGKEPVIVPPVPEIPADPAAEQPPVQAIRTMDNHMPAPPALGRDGK
ncbi:MULTISPECIES: hypothetical protein [unclassified Streptomyces]|uniref:hypothetical protein n=1 Tax=unclassified Streptomyces TaxID=2593676 RepID=UPI0022385517|nr:hypothetical protein [Streptomyces sp. SHP 1-2]MCW5254517.1 hypothetical protein [Streptomyces sp. SHP 1-2]